MVKQAVSMDWAEEVFDAEVVYVVLGSLVQSSLLSKFDKTETRTGPPRLKNHEKLDWTNVNRFSAVLVSFLPLKDRSCSY